MSRLYQYIGPHELYGSMSERHLIQNSEDVRDWIRETKQHPENGLIVATFIIDAAGQLWIADRRSEHVACTVGQPVLSAGEMAFAIEGKQISVVEVSNQSLGYCPEPSSWPAVSDALGHCGLSAPSYFTASYTIRLCKVCKSKNIIKDDIYECGVCESPLPKAWNF